MDEKSKTERIEHIADEVGELHPLLKNILPKLDRVTYIEHTHGPHEMGADFVLERTDEALGTTDYIGVIAKTEKILQNFTEVERQIDECAHPRLIRQGKSEVRLPEVWVITSKSISQNAKTKIKEKFSTRKINFFDSAWLVKRVDEHAPYFWDELTSSIGVYLSNLDKRLSVISTQTALGPSLTGSKIFIELDIEEIDTDRYKKNDSTKRVRLVNLIEEVEQNKITLLEANMGFGKSHTARRIANHFAETSTYKAKSILPIYSTFKSICDENEHKIESFIQKSLESQCYSDAKREQATFLIILDGIDEATSNIDKCRKCLISLVDQARAMTNVKLLMTSRPLKILDEISTTTSSASRYRILPLSIKKIIDYLKALLSSQSLPNHLLRDLGKSGLFKQLPRNPIAASLLANIINQDKYELPSNLTELYAKTLELMLGRWDEKRQISTEKMYRATERLARHIARHMLDNQLIYLSKSEIRQMVEAFLVERNTGILPDEVFDYLMHRSNLFGYYEEENDAVFFKHRSLAEYLYARDAYETRNFSIDERAFDPYWLNTFFFYIGSLGECPDVLEKIMRLTPNTETTRLIRMLHMGEYLLAGYQTPYSVIQQSLDVLIIEAARLFVDIRNGNIKSHLTFLSEMQLLWVFSATLRHCYGYDFFQKALPLSMASIDESLIDNNEIKSYALLFAAHALHETGDNCGFEFLIKTKKIQEMPTSVALALASEFKNSERSFVKSAAIKRYEKQFRQMILTTHEDRLGINSKLDSLYKEPLQTKIEARRALAVAKDSKVKALSRA